ncbi:MAG: hypothetical protein H5T50_04525 [Nitrososphaeria archaeon]|nr:hypothetical protein [Nitrososphaeria archaeon]
MVTVKFEKIKDKVAEFNAFVKEKKNIEGKVDGDTILFENIDRDDLRLLLKKFLHRIDGEDYRVISKIGVLTVVEKKKFKM